MNHVVKNLAPALFVALGPVAAASADEIILRAGDPGSVGDNWEQFNFTDTFGPEQVAGRMRSNVFGASGGRQPTLKFKGLDAALANAGKTKGDILGAQLELTVKNFDQENGLFTWTLYSVNDGVANEDFDFPNDTFHDLPAILDAVDVQAAVDLTQAVVQDSLTLGLGIDPRPQAGDLQVFNFSDLGFLTGDTNDTLVLHFHQTGGVDANFRPQWESGTSAFAVQPRLRIQLVPEPTTAVLAGLGGVLVLFRRRRAG